MNFQISENFSRKVQSYDDILHNDYSSNFPYANGNSDKFFGSVDTVYNNLSSTVDDTFLTFPDFTMDSFNSFSEVSSFNLRAQNFFDMTASDSHDIFLSSKLKENKLTPTNNSNMIDFFKKSLCKLSKTFKNPEKPHTGSLANGKRRSEAPDYFEESLTIIPTSFSNNSHNFSNGETKETVADRLRGIWNNVKYGWSPRITSNFDPNQAIILLGCTYSSPVPNLYFTNSSGHRYSPILDQFLRHYSSMIWFSYRYDFAPLPITNVDNKYCSKSDRPAHGSQSVQKISKKNPIRTSDAGWGCMIRTAQMLIAQALVLHFLGSDWSIFRSSKSERSDSLQSSKYFNNKSSCPSSSSNNSTRNPKSASKHVSVAQDDCEKSISSDSEKSIRFHPNQQLASEALYRQIIRWFGDSPNSASPFSIHQILRLSGKMPGQWFGPASVSVLMLKAFRAAHKMNPLLDQLDVYLAQDRQIFIQDIVQLFFKTNNGDLKVNSLEELEKMLLNRDVLQDKEQRSVIILIPVFLGNSVDFNGANYVKLMHSVFSIRQTIGVIGGRPEHSLYFIGIQGNELIHLDPHYTQKTVDVRKDYFPTQTYHNFTPKKLCITRLDPSCTFGFYCQNLDDLCELLLHLKSLLMTASSNYSMIEVMTGNRPTYDHIIEQVCAISDADLNSIYSVKSLSSQISRTSSGSFSNINDDFVVL